MRFLQALLVANLQMARVILFKRREELRPGFVVYPIPGLSRFELIVLSHGITLTPGTTTVDILEEPQALLIHALDASEPEKTIDSIKNELEAPLLAWTR